MKFRKVLSLLALLFNLDTILAGCTMEEEENKWNIIHWISRRVKGTASCVTMYVGVENVVSDGDLQLILKNVTDLEIFKPAIEFTKCIIIISNEVEVRNQVGNLNYPLTLFILLQDNYAHHSNPLELSRFMIITKCPLAFTYWDIHKQKFEGLWSTYYSTVVYRGEPITRDPDSFFNQTFRVGYNDYSWCFWYDNFTSDHFRIDKETYEGYYLIPFIETHQLQTIFINGNDTWGHIDEETGKWTGVVGMVGYGKADVGVSCIGYTYERSAIIDGSSPLSESSTTGWTTKYPEKRSATYNIFKVFDLYTWIAILVSLTLASLVVLVVSDILKSLGFKQPDRIIVVLMPFSLLNAEAMPDWFLFTQKRVYSGSIMLMTWAFASTIISLGFNSTLRAILLSPSWETFMDSSAQIAEREMTLIWDPEYNVHYDFMMASPNPDIMKIMNTAIFVNSTEDLLEIISEKGFENLVFFMEDLLPGNEYRLYESDEVLESSLSHWIFPKQSIWAELINVHVLRCFQADFDAWINIIKYNINFDEDEFSLEKLNLEHMAAAYVLLGIGLGLSALVFILELIYFQKIKSN